MIRRTRARLPDARFIPALLRDRTPDPAPSGTDPTPPEQDRVARAIEAADRARRIISHQARQIRRLERLVMIDPLTGLLNRRGFERERDRVMASARRYGEGGVMIFVDLDGFKLINDTCGHPAGDAVLRHVAQVLQGNVRKSDYVARYGGDEFVILLTRISLEDGTARAAELSRLINRGYLSWRGRTIALRATFGLQAYDGTEGSADLLELADHAMYEKKRGRSKGRPARVPREPSVSRDLGLLRRLTPSADPPA